MVGDGDGRNFRKLLLLYRERMPDNEYLALGTYFS